ncbi:MAG TPA: 3-dehydroquinate synthase [Chitinophagaceae bacterium]|nr:3-dehydroquinate synthase [Chitinophagaceae bacterium]
MSKKITYTFSDKTVSYYLNASFIEVVELTDRNKCIVITDSNVIKRHHKKFDGFKTIVIPAGEEHKNQATVESIIGQLIAMEADRTYFLLGVGGGVVTDITGYVAAIYMRGLSFGFAPTTVLAQVDAAIGGKNGIDVGIYKNLVGTIRQPDFILFDYSFLDSLPEQQWVNGFAEIIKHACIKDAELFALLEKNELSSFRYNDDLLASLIATNILIKSDVVQMDEFEQAERKLLNFGHTLGHAIENKYQLLHGYAISKGMVVAAEISEKLNQFDPAEKKRVINLLRRYNLPVAIDFDRQKAFETLRMDKKRVSFSMNFVLLNRIGEATVKPIPLHELEQIIQDL